MEVVAKDILNWQPDKPETFEQMFREWYNPLCNYAYGFVESKDEAEEVVQALFIELWERRNEIRLENPGPSYLFRAVRNRSLNVLKHEKVKREYAADSVRTTETAIHIQPETADLNSRIEKAMMKLPEQCRLVFRMSRFEELKYAEIAEKLGISIKTVENQMGKALRIMREELKDYLPLLALFMAGFID